MGAIGASLNDVVYIVFNSTSCSNCIPRFNCQSKFDQTKLRSYFENLKQFKCERLFCQMHSYYHLLNMQVTSIIPNWEHNLIDIFSY